MCKFSHPLKLLLFILHIYSFGIQGLFKIWTLFRLYTLSTISALNWSKNARIIYSPPSEWYLLVTSKTKKVKTIFFGQKVKIIERLHFVWFGGSSRSATWIFKAYNLPLSIDVTKQNYKRRLQGIRDCWLYFLLIHSSYHFLCKHYDVLPQFILSEWPPFIKSHIPFLISLPRRSKMGSNA